MWLMCRLLEVSTSGFYAWLNRGGEVISAEKASLMEKIREVFNRFRKRYGSPRVWRELKAKGINVSKTTVEDLMKQMGLKARPKKRYKSTTDSNHNKPVAPNLLDRNFNQVKIDAVWLSDITYLPIIGGGFVYLCVVMDLASREIIGWQVDSNMESSLVCGAFINAVLSREQAPRGAIFHSDQGSQYASNDFRKLLNLYGLQQSMSRRGQCWDNAPMESFFSSLKDEYDEEEVLWFRDLDDARSGLFDYIDLFYNRNRMHSGIGYQVPACYMPPVAGEETTSLT